MKNRIIDVQNVKITISKEELNDYIWLMSKNKELPKRPYHLTRTTNY